MEACGGQNQKIHPNSNRSTCLAEAMELCIAGNVEQSQGACWAHHLREEVTEFHVLKRRPAWFKAARVSPLKFYKCYGKVYKHLWASCGAISFSKITPKPSGAKPDRFPQAWPCQALLFQVDVGHIYIYIHMYLYAFKNSTICNNTE